jgi:hypothetical protein
MKIVLNTIYEDSVVAKAIITYLETMSAEPSPGE